MTDNQKQHPLELKEHAAAGAGIARGGVRLLDGADQLALRIQHIHDEVVLAAGGAAAVVDAAAACCSGADRVAVM